MRLAVLVEFHDLDGEVVADVSDGAQPVHLDALALGFFALFGVGGHLLCGASVDDDGLLGAEALGDARGIHGGVAAAVNSYAASNEWLLAGGDVVQKAHGVDHSGGINGWDVDAFG